MCSTYACASSHCGILRRTEAIVQHVLISLIEVYVETKGAHEGRLSGFQYEGAAPCLFC